MRGGEGEGRGCVVAVYRGVRGNADHAFSNVRNIHTIAQVPPNCWQSLTLTVDSKDQISLCCKSDNRPWF